MKWCLTLVALTAVLAGGGSHHAAASPARGRQWRAVLNDWLAHGMSDAAVASVAGLPRRVGVPCWLYSDVRVCFAKGRLALVQRVQHG